MKVALPADLAIDAEVDVGTTRDAFALAPRLNISNDWSSTSALTTRWVREMADIVAQLAPSADQRRSNVISDGEGLYYPLRASPVAILIGDPHLPRGADRMADRRRQVALCRNRRTALRDIDWRVSQVVAQRIRNYERHL